MMGRINPADHRRGLERVSRRLFLRGPLSIGGLSLLSGCNLEDDDTVDRILSAMSRWNDAVQAALFSSGSVGVHTTGSVGFIVTSMRAFPPPFGFGTRM